MGEQSTGNRRFRVFSEIMAEERWPVLHLDVEIVTGVAFVYDRLPPPRQYNALWLIFGRKW